jgi:cytochrome c biogenesis protein CcdA
MKSLHTALLVYALGTAISFAVAGLIMAIGRAIRFAEQRATRND